MNQKKERFVLGGISISLTTILLLLVLGPALFAQASSDQTRDAKPVAPRSAEQADPKYAQMFQQVMNFVMNRYVDPVDAQKLFDGAMKGMFEALGDPYTLYLTESDMMNLNDTTAGEFGGVGLYINKVAPTAINEKSDPKDVYVEVVAPIEDTPAFKAGVYAGDYITTINGESTRGMTMDKVLSILRGKPGTAVKIGLLRGTDTNFELNLTRALIEVPTVKTATLPGNYGYLRIIQFTAHTAEKVKPALQDFVKAGVKGLVIDLRNNPGGLLDSVAKVADNFFTDGTIVSTRSRIPGESSVFTADPELVVPASLPIIVLIDKGSASASEILAGALKDRKRAFLLGETTYGKGSVQQIIPFDKTGFKMTMARYYTPNDINIDKIGIKPDKAFGPKEYTDAELASFKRILQEKLIEKWVAANKNPDEAALKAGVAALKKQGIVIEDYILRKLIQNEVDRIGNKPSPVYDLDYDKTLTEALRMLASGEATVK